MGAFELETCVLQGYLAALSILQKQNFCAEGSSILPGGMSTGCYHSYLNKNEGREMGVRGNLWHSVKVGEVVIHWIPFCFPPFNHIVP